MIRKFLGLFLLVAIFSIIACGESTSNATDECDDDPAAPACVQPEDDPASAE